MTGTEFAEQWLRQRGLFDKDSDYEGWLGEATLDAWKFIMGQGHSGFSGPMVITLLEGIAEDYDNAESPIWKAYWESPEEKALTASFMGKEG